MAVLKDIKKRMSSVRNTQKITRAMKLVAAAKLKKAQNTVLEARHYAEEMENLVYRVSTSVGVGAPELMRRRSIIRKLDFVVIASDRGLCGGFNENLINHVRDVANTHRRHGVEIDLFVYGRKGHSACRKRKLETMMCENFSDIAERPEKIKQMADMLKDRFLSGESDGSSVVYNYFLSTAKQEIMFKDLLPFHHRRRDRAYQVEYIYEPSRESVHEEIVYNALSAALIQAFKESHAAELASRMMAMDAATRNADDMIEHLNMLYHRARQAGITRELMDIVNGAEALRQ